MAMRRKKKISLHEVSDFTRYYTDLPSDMETYSITVDDPYSKAGQTDKIRVLRAVRDDPLGEMHAKKEIDDAQFMAGRTWQAAYENSSRSNLKAAALEASVDGGGGALQLLSEHQHAAMLKLHKAAQVLGPLGDSIVRDVLGAGMSIRKLALKHGDGTGRTAQIAWGLLVRKSLDLLSIAFGFAAGYTIEPIDRPPAFRRYLRKSQNDLTTLAQ